MPTSSDAPVPVVDREPRVAETQGVVISLDDFVATIEMIDGGDEWVFPRPLLPDDVALDSVLTFAGPGQGANVVAHRPPAPSVEDRLGRALNRRRLHLS
jgi:hypothetical protein